MHEKKKKKNIERKGEIARNEQFLLFPQCFLKVPVKFPPFEPHLKFLSAKSFNSR